VEGIIYKNLSHGIVEFQNAFPRDFCKEIIKTFENNSSLYATRTEEENSVSWLKADTQVISKKEFFWKDYIIPSYKNITNFFELYTTHFGNLNSMFKDIEPSGFNVQRTLPGEGFHIWHCEQGPPAPNRCAVWSVYLNDVKEGGETEFLYQNIRVKPKEGSLLIFPANYTYMHRGNPPLKDAKYIITGWFEMLHQEFNK